MSRTTSTLTRVGAAAVFAFSAIAVGAQTLIPVPRFGSYGTVIGETLAETQSLPGVRAQDVKVLDSNGRPWPNVRVLFSRVDLSRSVSFGGQSVVEVVTDSEGVARGPAVTPILTERPLLYGPSGDNHGSANILVTLADYPTVSAYLRGEIRALNPAGYGCGRPLNISYGIELKVVSASRVSVKSEQTLYGVDLFDGDRIVARLSSVTANQPVEVNIPEGVTRVQAGSATDCQGNYGPSNVLSRADLAGFITTVSANVNLFVLALTTAALGLGALLSRRRAQ